MNIFLLDQNPRLSAQYQCDRHVVKMIVESAQMLSTAHRILDGELNIQLVSTKKNLSKFRRKKIYDHPWKELYKVTHPNHPCSVWVRESTKNYLWLYEHFNALCMEYFYRYGKTHATDELLTVLLSHFPRNLPKGDATPFVLAMKSAPECMDPTDPIGSYRKFYKTKKAKMKMKWTKREVPAWFLTGTPLDEMFIEMSRDPEKMKAHLTFTPEELEQESRYVREYYEEENRNILNLMSEVARLHHEKEIHS